MRLLVAYSGSDPLDTMFDDLERAGLPDRCEAVILSVIDEWLPSTDTISSDLHPLPIHHRETLERMVSRRAEVEGVAEQMQRRFPNWHVLADVRADSPAWGIIRRAEGWEDGWHADLVVLGATEKSTIQRMLLGSVSHQVLTFGKCSVRLARPAQKSADHALRLLIGVDGSQNSELALQSAGQRVWSPGTEAQIVCVQDSKMLAIPAIQAEGITSTKAAAEFIADHAARELHASGLAVTTYVTEGEPKHELIRQAEEISADCVFAGAHGLTRIERILLGSVSLSVAMRAPCSVEVVRTAKL